MTQVMEPEQRQRSLWWVGWAWGLFTGVGERVMERTGKIVITQNKATTHSQGDL